MDVGSVLGDDDGSQQEVEIYEFHNSSSKLPQKESEEEDDGSQQEVEINEFHNSLSKAPQEEYEEEIQHSPIPSPMSRRVGSSKAHNVTRKLSSALYVCFFLWSLAYIDYLNNFVVHRIIIRHSGVNIGSSSFMTFWGNSIRKTSTLGRKYQIATDAIHGNLRSFGNSLSQPDLHISANNDSYDSNCSSTGGVKHNRNTDLSYGHIRDDLGSRMLVLHGELVATPDRSISFLTISEAIWDHITAMFTVLTSPISMEHTSATAEVGALGMAETSLARDDPLDPAKTPRVENSAEADVLAANMAASIEEGAIVVSGANVVVDWGFDTKGSGPSSAEGSGWRLLQALLSWKFLAMAAVVVLAGAIFRRVIEDVRSRSSSASVGATAFFKGNDAAYDSARDSNSSSNSKRRHSAKTGLESAAGKSGNVVYGDDDGDDDGDFQISKLLPASSSSKRRRESAGSALEGVYYSGLDVLAYYTGYGAADGATLRTDSPQRDRQSELSWPPPPPAAAWLH